MLLTRRLGISVIASVRLCGRLTASFCVELLKSMRHMLGARCAEWDAATRGTRLLLSEQSSVPEKFGCKLSRTLTRLHCTSLSMTTQHRIQRRSTLTKCPRIGGLKM